MQTRATVHRLRPRGRRHAELLQGALDLGGWSDAARVELMTRMNSRLPEPEGWSFVMATARPDTTAAFLKEVGAGPRAYATLATWNALAPYVRRDTGEILASQRTLARTASLTQGDVSRGLARLVELNALLREDRGRYRVHPDLLWRGDLAGRAQVATGAPPLRLVKSTDEVES